MADKFLPDVSDYTSTLLVQNLVGLQNISYQKRVLWTTKYNPLYAPTHKFSFVSLPVLTWMAQLGIDEVNYSGLYIQLHDSSDTDLINRIADDLKEATGLKAFKTYQ